MENGLLEAADGSERGVDVKRAARLVSTMTRRGKREDALVVSGKAVESSLDRESLLLDDGIGLARRRLVSRRRRSTICITSSASASCTHAKKLTHSTFLASEPTGLANEDGRLVLKHDLARLLVLGRRDARHSRRLALVEDLHVARLADEQIGRAHV